MDKKTEAALRKAEFMAKQCQGMNREETIVFCASAIANEISQIGDTLKEMAEKMEKKANDND